MQYIQLQSQIAEDLDLPLEGSFNLFIDTADNSIKAKDFEGNLVGGGGLSLVEVTSAEIHQMAESASLTPGAFYKITGAASRSFLEENGFGYNGWTTGPYSGGGNEIQSGGTTIILQATSEKTLSKKGVGLFYVPNYEDPNNPTLPPDYNFLTWDDTHRFYVDNVSGRFELNEYVELYSSNTDTSTYGYLQGSLHSSGSSGALTLRLEYGDDHFLDNSDNLIGLTITGQNSYATCDYDSIDYINSYAIDTCVVYGGRVWKNISGNIGNKFGGWPGESLYLNTQDWEIVPFDEVHYTLVANEIQYEFEYDNISYRSDGRNEVFSDWKWWDNNWGYNNIHYFPWGHFGVERVSISNSYIENFVNFPWDAEAWNIKFEDGGEFDAEDWGRGSGFYDIQAEKNAQFYGHNFSNGANIEDIKLGINSDFYDISTYDNDYGDYNQIYEITVENNGSFGSIDMYYGSYIEYAEIGTEADLRSFTMYEYSRIRDVKLEINSYLGDFLLWNSAEIKYVHLGVNSYIEYFALQYSSCLKRTTLGTDAYIQFFDLGQDSFIRQVNLSERAYLSDLTIGASSNFQNIDMGAYSYMYDIECGYNSDIQNIRLDARANMYQIYMGYESEVAEIQIAPDSSLHNIQNGSFTGSYIAGISIKPDSTINSIDLGSMAYIENIQLGNGALFGALQLQESAHISNLHLMGSGASGEITLESGSYINNFQIGINSGFGGMSLSNSVSLTNFEIQEGNGFGGQNFTSSLEYVTISRAFNNFQINNQIAGTTGSLNFGDPMVELNSSKSFIILDTTGWDAATSDLNYYLSDGYYDGQTVKFALNLEGSNIISNHGRLKIWANLSPAIDVNGGGNNPWYPFTNPAGDGIRYDMPTAVWLNGKWLIDNNQFG